MLGLFDSALVFKNARYVIARICSNSTSFCSTSLSFGLPLYFFQS
jgi:hypothetical protein